MKKLLLTRTREPWEERLHKAFPGSEWVPPKEPERQIGPDSSHPGIVTQGPDNGTPGFIAEENPLQKPVSLTGVRLRGESSAVGVIGGGSFDEAKLASWLRTLPPDTILVSIEGLFKEDGEPYSNSFEAKFIQLARELGVRVDIVGKNKDLYASRAGDVAICDVIRASGEIMLIGKSAKVKFVRDIQKDWARTKATLGGRLVHELEAVLADSGD